jgi:GT2 family glycosyltransferase
MIRREVFERCGYFREDLIQTYTEPHFALHAAGFGFKCAMVPAARTYHHTEPDVGPFTSRGLGATFDQRAYCLLRNRTILVAEFGRCYHKLLYAPMFSLLWPSVYSLFALRLGRRDLVRLYWMGWLDGILYLLTGHLRNSLPRRAGYDGR